MASGAGLAGGSYNIVLFDINRISHQVRTAPGSDASVLLRRGRITRGSARSQGQPGTFATARHVAAVFDELMSRLGRVDCTASGRVRRERKRGADQFHLERCQLRGRREIGCRKNGARARFEQLSVLFRHALSELDAARTPHSGSPHRFIDVIVKLRNFENKSKILRFLEIRFDSISTCDTLQRGANGPEDRPRSAWNEIAIPVANSGSPSVSRRFHSTLIGVDGVGAIGVSGDCEKP